MPDDTNIQPIDPRPPIPGTSPAHQRAEMTNEASNQTGIPSAESSLPELNPSIRSAAGESSVSRDSSFQNCISIIKAIYKKAMIAVALHEQSTDIKNSIDESIQDLEKDLNPDPSFLEAKKKMLGLFAQFDSPRKVYIFLIPPNHLPNIIKVKQIKGFLCFR